MEKYHLGPICEAIVPERKASPYTRVLATSLLLRGCSLNYLILNKTVLLEDKTH